MPTNFLNSFNSCNSFLARLAVLGFACSLLFSYLANGLFFLGHLFLIIPSFFYFFKEKQWKFFSTSNLCLFFFILWSLVSLAVSSEHLSKMQLLKDFLSMRYFFLGLMAMATYQYLFSHKILSDKTLRILLTLFLLILILGNLSGIIGLFTGFNPLRLRPTTDLRRATGLFSLAITYGNAISLVTITLLGGLVFAYDKIKLYISPFLYVTCLVSCFAGLYFSYTRGAFLAVLVSMAFIVYKKNKKLFCLLSLFMALVFSIFLQKNPLSFEEIAPSTPNNTQNKKNRLIQPLNSESNMIRISLYKAALLAFTEKPIFGMGYRKFEKNSLRIKEQYNLPFKDFEGHAHSNYLEMLAGTGLVGMLAFIFFLFFWFFETNKREDFIGKIISPVVVAFMVSGLFQNTATDSENMFFLMFLYSLSYLRLNFSGNHKEQSNT